MFRDSGRPATPVRKPQQDRSRATRERLISATIDVLATEGWSASTVSVVAERAGVSRGAAQHHFPTRESLITATLEQTFDELTGRASVMYETLPEGPGRVEAAVTRAVDIYTGTQFKAALQVWSAAASDPGLRDLIRPLERKFARAAHRMTVQAIAGDTDDPGVHRLVQATLDMARGLGLADTLSDDSARRKQVVATWSEVLAAALN
ncbi:TetR/AcrR family transcriptional regulator [Williamsia phyllosphaerae]|uniref:TetR family transcriptional regulator n=1 Tax=Williamsia phyllosphaerae TaxID=885042 RepID=A0ABQ1UQH8_9NOCA|nr:TetR/AcrR family transcriptional regulator [Williamsia phyllosphaerae]GGF24101.1 TetR family transcriptional regulator [Williamsia phyllosphaerae]